MLMDVERHAKCGGDCSRCPWSSAVHATFDDENAFADYRHRCKHVLGYSPSENVFRDCVGCHTPNDEIPQEARVPLKNCLVRRCVDRRGIRNCAYCSRFPCGYIQDCGDEWGREKIEAKHGAPISEEDYAAFVEPFEGLRHLHEIRATLDPSEVRNHASLSPLKSRITKFPGDAGLPGMQERAHRSLHSLLEKIATSSLGLADTDTFAQQERLRGRILCFLLFLWILGRFGELVGDRLRIRPEGYLANRGSQTELATVSYLEGTLFPVFAETGIRAELRPLGKRWTTPGGGLRKENWEISGIGAFDRRDARAGSASERCTSPGRGLRLESLPPLRENRHASPLEVE